MQNRITEDVKYLTPEVIDLIDDIYFKCTREKGSTVALKEFLNRNNLNLSIDDLKKMKICNSPAIPELEMLSTIQDLFRSGTNPKIIRTPKQNILVLDNFKYSFRDDYVNFIEMCVEFNNFYVELEYTNSHLMYMYCCQYNNNNFIIGNFILYFVYLNDKIREIKFNTKILPLNVKEKLQSPYGNYPFFTNKEMYVKTYNVHLEREFNSHIPDTKSVYNEFGDCILNGRIEYAWRYSKNYKIGDCKMGDRIVPSLIQFFYNSDGNCVTFSTSGNINLKYEYKGESLYEITSNMNNSEYKIIFSLRGTSYDTKSE